MKNGTKIAIIISSLVLSVPFFSYAQIALDKFVEEVPLLEKSVKEVFAPARMVQIKVDGATDVRLFMDQQYGTLCYFYGNAISCVKN